MAKTKDKDLESLKAPEKVKFQKELNALIQKHKDRISTLQLWWVFANLADALLIAVEEMDGRRRAAKRKGTVARG